MVLAYKSLWEGCECLLPVQMGSHDSAAAYCYYQTLMPHFIAASCCCSFLSSAFHSRHSLSWSRQLFGHTWLPFDRECCRVDGFQRPVPWLISPRMHTVYIHSFTAIQPDKLITIDSGIWYGLWCIFKKLKSQSSRRANRKQIAAVREKDI